MTLQRLALLRGQFEAGPNAWGIMPLAVERLFGEGGAPKLLMYSTYPVDATITLGMEAGGRGVLPRECAVE